MKLERFLRGVCKDLASMATREGGELLNEGRAMSETFADQPVTAPATTGGTQGGAQAEAFPRRFGGATRYDDEMNMKMQLMDDNGMTPFGQVYYDDKVGRWLEKKQQVAELANLDSWFGANFNKNNLADRQFAQTIYPEYYSAREQEMARKAKAALDLKLIQLRGPQSKEDMYKLWLINTGRVTLPEDWDRIGPAGFKGAAEESKLFKAGLLKIPKLRTQTQRADNARQAQKYGLWGDLNAAAKDRNMFSSGMDYASDVKNKPLAKGPETDNLYTYDFLRQ